MDQSLTELMEEFLASSKAVLRAEQQVQNALAELAIAQRAVEVANYQLDMLTAERHGLHALIKRTAADIARDAVLQEIQEEDSD